MNCTNQKRKKEGEWEVTGVGRVFGGLQKQLRSSPVALGVLKVLIRYEFLGFHHLTVKFEILQRARFNAMTTLCNFLGTRDL